MPLGRIQTKIIRELVDLNVLAPNVADSIINSENDLSGDAIEKLLLEEHRVTDETLLIARARAFDLHPFNARNFVIDEFTFEKLDRDFCFENKVLPVGVVGEYFVVALNSPFKLQLTNQIAQKTRMRVVVLLALEGVLDHILSEPEQNPASIGFSDVVEKLGMEFQIEDSVFEEDDEGSEESAPIIQLANRIIEDAYYSGGSDIHNEPFENEARVRVRVDGVCQEKLNIPVKVCSSLLARLKVMANLDIAEKRIPQDGRIVYKQFNRKGIDIDLRVATAPLNHGEGVVMRILDKQKSTLPLTALGFSEFNLTRYRDVIQRPYGMILHCGPTGSGKSMTLYSALNEINTPDINIRTAEDPIEYTLNGLCQMQMNRKIGLTFAAALRAFLRQDPDIILVGEIRDKETAQIAVEAALTGHLLFSTLHTNDAPSAVARLTDMNIEPFMISASLLCVCAQRLMRRVCKISREPYVPEGNEAEIIERALRWVGEIYRASATGPNAATGGYKGRVGVHELMLVTEELVKGINDGLETAELKRIAMRNGMKTLHQDCILKVKEGVTTMEEALATVPPDMEAYVWPD
ncbi:MAG: GspE/PulE family protein [Puniceicoccaceae bacterium]